MACTMDSKIVIWGLQTKERIVALIEHGRGVLGLAVSRDDRFMVTFGGDQAIFMMGLIEHKIASRMEGH